jgi:hypothetical protein
MGIDRNNLDKPAGLVRTSFVYYSRDVAVHVAPYKASSVLLENVAASVVPGSLNAVLARI